MKAQKLRTFGDFLKRAEIIPQSLLVITNDSDDCSSAVKELRALNYDMPFYELNLSENPNLISELSELYDIDDLPMFIYFRGKKMVSKIIGHKKNQDYSGFLTSAVNLDG